jgi:2-polyprenyl-3-methyl-5-hydroxy-6-metoxy-1,4-benzoquinol methylase
MNKRMPACPQCAKEAAADLGALPESRWFAGRLFNSELIRGNLFICKHCHLKFRYPRPDTTNLSLLYDNKSFTTWPTDSYRADWEKIIKYIRERHLAGGSVLDFGCYTGGLMKALGSDYHGYGVEINTDAAIVARSAGCACVWRTLSDIPPHKTFDVIMLCDVIEHMTDPAATISELSARLIAGGSLIITTGDADNTLWNRFGANWWYCFYPEHISFISRAWLAHFLKSSELTLTMAENFRYCRLSLTRYLVDAAGTLCYGLAPKLYLQLVNTLRRARKRLPASSVPGNGISKDHLFIALTKRS